MDLPGLGAIVTGGISGLGLATSEALEAGGARVALLDRREPSPGSTRYFVQADVSNDEDVDVAVHKAAQHLGSIHVAVNCAGMGVSGLSVGEHRTLTARAFRKVLEVNTLGTFNVCRSAAEQMIRNTPNADGERGVLINVSSTAALEGQIGTTAYAASKAAVIGLMLPLARELAPHGIRIVTIVPGIFETEMFRAAAPEMQDWLLESTPFPSRVGKPAEFASLVRQIVENPMLNGELIRLDGMLRLGSGRSEWFHPST